MKDLKSLYETDYALWLDRTIANLKERKLDSIDWENLIEEVESLGKSDKRELESRLTNLFEHLLKRKYVNLPECFRGWVNTITREQQEISKIIKSSPSLANYMNQNIEACWKDGLKRVTREYYEINFPTYNPFPSDPDRLLNDVLWE